MRATAGASVSAGFSAAVVEPAFVFPDELQPATDNIIAAAKAQTRCLRSCPKRAARCRPTKDNRRQPVIVRCCLNIVNVPFRTFVTNISYIHCDYNVKVEQNGL